MRCTNSKGQDSSADVVSLDGFTGFHSQSPSQTFIWPMIQPRLSSGFTEIETKAISHMIQVWYIYSYVDVYHLKKTTLHDM